jgi:hypothetical protein
VELRSSVVNELAGCLTAGIFILVVTIPGLAQGGNPGAPAGAGPPANINPNIDARQRQVDESRLRGAEMNVDTERANEKLLQAAITNMKEDFSRIQVLRNDIARNLIAQKPFDYQLLSSQTAEINKRASRLNVYMRAHSVEAEKGNNPPELKSAEMVDALVRLCKLIDGFTENPALKNAATIDSKEMDKAKENKANADRDLLAIIKLSSSLQKMSENLRTP